VIGAKEFAIGRKVPNRKQLNPIARSILNQPEFTENESELKTKENSLMEAMKPRSISYKPKEKEEIFTGSNVIGNILKILNNAPIISYKQSVFEHEICDEDNKKESSLSDEEINKITYKVFQKMQKFLTSSKEKENTQNTRQIKISIDM